MAASASTQHTVITANVNRTHIVIILFEMKGVITQSYAMCDLSNMHTRYGRWACGTRRVCVRIENEMKQSTFEHESPQLTFHGVGESRSSEYHNFLQIIIGIPSAASHRKRNIKRETELELIRPIYSGEPGNRKYHRRPITLSLFLVYAFRRRTAWIFCKNNWIEIPSAK